MTTITIDRAIVEQALEFVTSEGWGTTPYMDVCVYEDAALLREALRAALAEQPQDWDETDALRESLREHMAEIHRLRAELAAHIGGANEMVTTNLESRPVEPVGKVTETSDSGFKVEFTKFLDSGTNLYTAHAKGESEGLVDAQVVYQISMKNGATSSAWIDVDEAAYNSAKVYGEYKCRCLYTAPPQRKPLTDEEIEHFAREAYLIAESIWVDDSHDDITAFTTALARFIEQAHGIGDA
jgi:hypothetical protein